MNTTIKTYPAYKDTGLPWIGRCPAHWSLRRMKYLFDERVEKGFPDEPLLTASQSHGVIRKTDYGSRTVEAQKDLHLLKLVEPGDYVISLRSFQGGIEYAHVRGIISPAYTVLKPMPSVHRGFYEHFFKSNPFISSMSLFVTGIREGQNIDYVRLSRVYMPLPPSDEQEAIGRFIRYLDHRVNRLIKAKRRLIELLNEQKQAIIHRAVTRGLDPNAPLKPSGIDWIGAVPAHWTVIGLRLRYSVELGKMLDGKRITGDYLVPYLRNTDVQWDKIRSDDLPKMDIRPEEYERYTVRRGDLLVCEGGEVGRSAMWMKTDSVIGFQKALHRLRPKSGNVDNPRFLMYLFFYVAKIGVFKSDGSENTIAHLTSEKLRKYRFAFPDRNEQDLLVEYIDRESRTVNLAIEKAQEEIELIREYRTRLVADVVTGQMDVRHLTFPDLEESLSDSSIADEEEDDDVSDALDDGETEP